MVVIKQRSISIPLASRNSPSISTSSLFATPTTTASSPPTETPSSGSGGSHWSAGDLAALIILVLFAVGCVMAITLWRVKVWRRRQRLNREMKVADMLHSLGQSPDGRRQEPLPGERNSWTSTEAPRRFSFEENDEEGGEYTYTMSQVSSVPARPPAVYQEATAVQLQRATPRVVRVSPRSSLSSHGSVSSVSSDDATSARSTHFDITLPRRSSLTYPPRLTSPSSYDLDAQHFFQPSVPTMDYGPRHISRKPTPSASPGTRGPEDLYCRPRQSTIENWTDGYRPQSHDL